MTDQPRTIALVLDTSAIAGFVRGSVAVGELLAEVDAEHGAVLIPLPCLIETAASIPDGHAWLDILTSHAATWLVSDDPEDWRMVAHLRAIVGSYDTAVAAWLALDAGVDVMTRHPDLYAKVSGGAIALPFDD